MSNLAKRISEYCKHTQVEFKPVDRYQEWQAFGLPDMRSFTPHLRTINLYKDQKKKNHWLLHDALHIIFYDYATAHLGLISWQNRERFLENHLASELFAVLTLDYHDLVHTDLAGLTVDLHRSDWESFQKVIPTLPEMRSLDFFKHLFNCYFSGYDSILSPKTLKKAKGRLAQWLGHELRYTQKQREYALMWWNDLNLKPQTKKHMILENSAAHYPIWDLAQIFLNSSNDEWNDFLKFIEYKTKSNYFVGFKKYKTQLKNLDFRFTDILGLEKEMVLKNLKKAKAPSSSSTFLFWQIIAMKKPSRFANSELKTIVGFSKEAQSKKINKKIWNDMQNLCLNHLNDIDWRVDSSRKISFFLP